MAKPAAKQRVRNAGCPRSGRHDEQICDWARFRNRRQVASYTGLCPGVHTSDGHGREGSINRCRNRAVRTALVELVWRLARWQPDYKPVRALVDKAS